MKRNLLMVGLPIVAGLSLTLASCGNPAAEREGGLQQPGAAPTNVEEDDEDAPGGSVNAQDDEDEDDNEND